jgi:hypothetical protein
VKFVMLPFEAKKFVEVTLVAVTEANTPFQRSEEEPSESVASSVGMRSVTTPEVTPKNVVVTALAVTLFKVEVPETVRSLETTKFPVDVPPLNWMAFVVVLPAFVTVWRFGVVPLGQFVPFARQTATPFTRTWVADTLPPVMFWA